MKIKLGDYVTAKVIPGIGNPPMEAYPANIRQAVVVKIEETYLILQGQLAEYIVYPDVTLVKDEDLYGDVISHVNAVREQLGLNNLIC